MRHICLYIRDPDISCGGMDGRVFHEALTDLKIEHGAFCTFLCKIFGAKKTYVLFLDALMTLV